MEPSREVNDAVWTDDAAPMDGLLLRIGSGFDELVERDALSHDGPGYASDIQTADIGPVDSPRTWNGFEGVPHIAISDVTNSDIRQMASNNAVIYGHQRHRSEPTHSFINQPVLLRAGWSPQPAPSPTVYSGGQPTPAEPSASQVQSIQSPGVIKQVANVLRSIRRKKRRSKFSPQSVNVLSDWLDENRHDPYPTAKQKRDLAQASGLTEKQVSTWFTNWRKRQDPMEAWLSGEEAVGATTIENAMENWDGETESGVSRYPEVYGEWEQTSDQGLQQHFNQLPSVGTSQRLRSGSRSGQSSGGASSFSGASSGRRSAARSPRSMTSPVIRKRSPRKGRRKLPRLSSQTHRSEDGDASEDALSPTATDKVWPCTFCRKKFSTRAWKRHEESHIPQHRWICLLTGPIKILPNNVVVCAFCNLTDPDEAHLHTHRISDCLDSGRAFSRRDHLNQHFKNFHRGDPNFNDIISCWNSKIEDNPNQAWVCGFCGFLLPTWEERAVHISNHFREGLDMKSWKPHRRLLGNAVPLLQAPALPSVDSTLVADTAGLSLNNVPFVPQPSHYDNSNTPLPAQADLPMDPHAVSEDIELCQIDLRSQWRYKCTDFECSNVRFRHFDDWQQHELAHYRHRQPDIFKCQYPIVVDGSTWLCGEIFTNYQNIESHLIELHQQTPEMVVYYKGRAWIRGDLEALADRPFNIWCGFCAEVVEVKGQGSAMARKMDHVVGHMKSGVEMSLWIPVTTPLTPRDGGPWLHRYLDFWH